MNLKWILFIIGMVFSAVAVLLILTNSTILGVNRSNLIPLLTAIFVILGFMQLYVDFRNKKNSKDFHAVKISDIKVRDWALLLIGGPLTLYGLGRMFIFNDLAYGLVLSLAGIIVLSFFGYFVTDGRKKS